MDDITNKAGISAYKIGIEYTRKKAIVFSTLILILGFGEGFLLSYFLYNQTITLILLITTTITIYFAFTYGIKLFEKLDTKRLNYHRGALGEMYIENLLKLLPNDYKTIHDIPFKHGNIDHVVIGPTGIFIIDTKNWRGIVSSNDKNELLLNNSPTDKPYIQNFQKLVFDIRNSLLLMYPNLPNPFLNMIFVFPSAKVEAKWGSTQNIDCMQDDEIIEYILDKKNFKLYKDNIKKFEKVFRQLKDNESLLTNPV